MTRTNIYGITYHRGDFCAKSSKDKKQKRNISYHYEEINRQTLFEDEEDCVKFIQTLQRYREICEYKLYAYCLMDYIEGSNQTDIDFALDIFNTDREKAIRSFIEHINKENDDKCLDIPDKQRLTDDDARKIIKAHCKIDHAIDIQKFDVDKRNLYLKDLMDRYSLSIRQLERLTGISRGIIQRI